MSTTITTEQVKELRDQTSVSVMQCRKALEEADGDMEKALIILRKKGSEMAEKKSDRSALDGRIMVKNENGKAVVLILHCETDFVAQNDDFKNVESALLDIAYADGIEAAQAKAPELINAVVLKIGENIQLGTIDILEGETIGTYTHHNGKNACVVVLKGGNAEVAKDVAMHAAAMKPRYITSSEIDEKEKAEATAVLRKEVDESGKPEEIKQKMLEGKLQSYFSEQTLVDQSFFKDPSVTIAQHVAKAGGVIEIVRVYVI